MLLQYAFSSVVVVSRDIQSHLTTDLKFSLSQVPVVHNGIHLPESITSKFPNLPFVVGSSGRLFPVKDYPLMVQIARAVAQKSDIHFTLAGDGPRCQSLKTVSNLQRQKAVFNLWAILMIWTHSMPV